MATTDSTTSEARKRWIHLASTPPVVAPDDYFEFFASAPTGTVVEQADELFTRLHNGDWRYLEEIDQAMEGEVEAEHCSSDYSALAARMHTLPDAPVRVLLLGERVVW